MGQVQTKDTLSKDFGLKSSIKERFEAISSQPATRTVNLITQSCCGCGCSDVDITRVVPFDSPLNNGDRVGKILEGDRVS